MTMTSTAGGDQGAQTRNGTPQPEDVEAYLTEARILARLDQPNIVPVHDVGRSEDGLCYVVSKLITGSSLAAQIEQDRPGLLGSSRAGRHSGRSSA